MTPDAHHQSVLPLDEGLYKLDCAFFKQQTGIDDNDELKTHLLCVQADAYEVTLFLVYSALSDPIMPIIHARCIHTPVYASFHGQGMSIL
jgi:hypothetical protein